ncbi:MAG: holo-ACP synthase [Cytophagales bacterium]|nr:holo-ACP synthase [Armatimonadota bacterium]
MIPMMPVPGRVVAVGVDLADVNRVRSLLARHPLRFAQRVLSEKEATYCLSRPDPAPHIAARFAAKEAVIKCLGGGCALREIEVERALSGAPSVKLYGRAKARAGRYQVRISLSHLEQVAAAFAVLVAVDETDAP